MTLFLELRLRIQMAEAGNDFITGGFGNDIIWWSW